MVYSRAGELCICLSRVHEVYCHHNVLSKSHVYGAAALLQSIDQISKQVQSMKNQNAADPQGNIGFLVIRIASFGAA